MPLLPYYLFNKENFKIVNYIFSISRYSNCSKIDAITYTTSLILSPFIETFTFYLIYKLTYRIKKFSVIVVTLTYILVLISSLFLHGGSLSNIGQAINFCIMWKIYRNVAKSPTDLGPYLTVSLVHFVWNGLAMLTVFTFDMFIAPGLTAPSVC
jgi:hypothetical protein